MPNLRTLLGRKTKIKTLAPLLALTLCGCEYFEKTARFKIREYAHPQWGNVIHVANTRIEFIVAPERGGRLMHFSRLGESNLLWTAADINGGFGDVYGWRNWGGEKTWLWPQEKWPGGNWPPPHDVEQAPWRVDKIETSKWEGNYWVEINLSAQTTEGKIERLFNTSIIGTHLSMCSALDTTNSAFSVWSITQIPAPETIGVERVEPRRLLLQMPGAENALALRGDGTVDVAATPGGTKGMMDATAFRVPTAQGTLVVRQEEDPGLPYDDTYRAQVYISTVRDGDA